MINFDYDDIMRQYNDRMEMGEPEPIDSFLPDPRDLPPASTCLFLMTSQDSQLCQYQMDLVVPGMSIGDMLEGRVTSRGPTGSIEVYDDNLRPPEPICQISL